MPDEEGHDMAFVALERNAGITRQASAIAIIRRVLDIAYLWSAYLAAASLMMILLLTMAQVICRYADINVRGLSDYAGYFMASSAFLAFAHTLNQGAHVRIELFLGMLGRFRRHMELLSFAVAACIAGWFAYYACTMVYWSYKFNDISTGLDATPLWIPQSAMAIGSILFAVAIFDRFVRLMFTGAHGIPAHEIGN
jgi:TRAP-type C4-dicarboxylate transport system permease small subunit